MFCYMFDAIYKKFSVSWSLTKTAFFYISRDAELFWYSVLSAICTFIVLGITILVLVLLGALNWDNLANMENNALEAILVLVGFIFYLLSSFISYFFRAAIATSVERRLAGQDNSFFDGIGSAFRRIGKIFVWSLVESTVFLLIEQFCKIFEKVPAIGKIVKKILTATWNIMTYFSFSLMVLTNKGVKDSMKTSLELFKKTWGERAILHVASNAAMSLIFFYSISSWCAYDLCCS